MNSLEPYNIPIDTLPINIAVYEIKNNEIFFFDFNKKAEQTDKISKDAIVGKKLIDIFPSVKFFGLYDAILRVYNSGITEELGTHLYSDSRIKGWRTNSVIKLTDNRVMAVYKDLTREKFLENELEQIFELNPNITFITDGKHILRANKKFLKFTGFDTLNDFKDVYECICYMFLDRKGYLQPEMDGKTWVSYIMDNVDMTHKAIIVKENIEYTFSIRIDMYEIDSRDKFIIVLDDISMIEKFSHTDYLTQICNRSKLDDFLINLFSSYERYGRIFSIILIDIDNFKVVNDTHGHIVGDYVLKEIADVLNENIRESDIIGRWGGEEFLIICPETTLEGSFALANYLKEKIQNHNFENVNNQTASFGVNMVS